MAVFVLDPSGTPITVPVQTYTERTPILIGARTRSGSGNVRISVRRVIRVWQVITTPTIDTTLLASIKAAIGNGEPLTCGGDMFMGATPSLTILYTDIPVMGIAEPVAGYPWLYQLQLDLEEA